MSTLPEITEALCTAVAKRNFDFARVLVHQAASKMGGERAVRIHDALLHKTLTTTVLKHWVPVHEPRRPWCAESTELELRQWLLEAQNAALLAEHGERVRPLLLVGETRCGKTSILASMAAELGISVNRLPLASAVGELMGSSARVMRDAFAEIRVAERALWLIDEIDGVAMRRASEGAAGQERMHSVASLLAEIESLPSDTMLVATTNVDNLVDPAVLARFTVVRFTPWESLGSKERGEFARSHGSLHREEGSYAAVVQNARLERIRVILQKNR